MSDENKALKLAKVAKEFNISLSSVVEFLTGKGYAVERNPNFPIDNDMYRSLGKEYGKEKELPDRNKIAAAFNSLYSGESRHGYGSYSIPDAAGRVFEKKFKTYYH